ncbi:MAG: ribosome silencing factor [Flavobacteriaceae bacterium]|jgi:iojap-like protein|nr:MAG: ribosome silencing factor [Riemerella sp.]
MEEYIEKKLLIEKIIEAIQDTKGEDIKLLDLTKIENSAADYFIICSANSNTQVNAIAGNIEKKVRNELKNRPWHVEGTENAMWILVDYISVVVHIFQKHIREFYDLEDLWSDAQITSIDENNNFTFK